MDHDASRLSRRQLMASTAGLGLLAACGRLPWQPEPRANIYRLGYAGPQITEPFREGLRELGYVEGANLLIEYRDPAGRADRLPELVAELVALPVDIIVAPNTATVIGARERPV